MRFLQARASVLLKPYFVILILIGVLKILKAAMLGSLGQQHIDYFIGIIYGTGSTIAWPPMWFLPHLFVTSTVSLIILKAIAAKTESKAWLVLSASVLLLVGICFIGAFWRPGVNNTNVVKVSGLPGLPWSVDLIPITSALIIFGFLLGERIKSMTFSTTNFAISIVIFSCLHFFFNETIDLNSRVYGATLISTTQAIMGIYITISVASFLQRYPSFRKSLGYIGSGSLFILIFHGVFQDLAFGVLSKVNTHLYLNGVASVAIGVALPLLFWEEKWPREIGRSDK